MKMLKIVSTIPPKNKVYDYLKTIINNKPYHIITTNQDMLFKKSFPDEHVSEIQGSWGYFQSKNTVTDKHLYPINRYLDDLLPRIDNNRLPTELIPKSAVDGTPGYVAQNFLKTRNTMKSTKRPTASLVTIGKRRSFSLKLG